MIKKIIPLIAVFTILIGSISVKATSVPLEIPTDMFPEYGGLAQTIIQILSSGGQISLEDLQSVQDLLNNPDIAIQSVRQSPSGDIIVDYYAKGSLTNNTHERLAKYREEQMLAGNDYIDTSTSCYVGWGPYEFSTFAGYSEFWLNKFQSEVIEPEPDPLPNEYRSYMNSINGHGDGQFSFYNFSSDNCNLWVGGLASNYSYMLQGYKSAGTFFQVQNTKTFPLYAIDKLTVHINGSGDNYSVSYVNSFNVVKIWKNQNYVGGSLYVNDSYYGNRAGDVNATLFGVDNRFYNITGSLSHCLNILSINFRNLNIYVNGVLWDINYQPIVEVPDVDFPDVIGVGNYDNLAYDVIMPDTTTGEAWYDVTALLSRVNDIINDQTHDRTLTYEDISDLVVDDAGEIADTVTKSIADVLSEPIIISATGDYPNLPFDDDAIKNAFHGSSILAELIDACANILPSELVVVFWGIVFILFIVGLIKIMHK